MKKFNCILIGILFFGFGLVNAQETASNELKTNPSTNCTLRYYYYPNLEAYYDLKKNVYHFQQNGKWITAAAIPSGYRGYSLNNKLNVAITDYDDDDVLQFIKIHKKKYPYMFSGKRAMTASIPN